MRLYTKLLLSYSVIFILLMFSVSIFQYEREKDFRREQLNTRLSAYNDILFNNYFNGDSSSISNILKIMPDTALRVSIIDLHGFVIYDSSTDTVIHENHLLREEIRNLSTNSFGYSIRRSSIDGIEYYYFAQKFENVYVRTALPYNVTLTSALSANLDFLYFFGIAVLIVMALIFFISHNLSESVKRSEHMQRRQLTQNVAHELKTPVAAILGYTESLVYNPDMDKDKQSYFIERTYKQSRRLTSLLDDISTLNKLNENKKIYVKENVDVVGIIYDIIRDTEDIAKMKNVSIEMLLPPDIIINGNKSLVYSIFRNLVDNSISYAGENIVIRIVLTHVDPQYYYFSVSDNGCGVANDHLPHLFERFYRVDKGRSRKAGGTGLGLAIVKNAVLFHKGNISVQNAHNGGLEFIFSLHK